MTASSRPTSSTTPAKTALASSIGGVFIASIVSMCGGAIGSTLLFGGYQLVSHSSHGLELSTLLLGGVSVRAFLANATAAAVFVAAYPSLPTAKRVLEREWGTLRVGAVLGTAFWFVMRAIMGGPAGASLALTVVVWLGFSLVRGPLIVWVMMPYVAAGDASQAPIRDGQRQIGSALALIFPTIFPLVWLGTEAGKNTMIMGALFGLFAIAVAVLGVSRLLGGIWQARGLRGRKLAQAVPLLLAGAVVLGVWLFAR